MCARCLFTWEHLLPLERELGCCGVHERTDLSCSFRFFTLRSLVCVPAVGLEDVGRCLGRHWMGAERGHSPTQFVAPWRITVQQKWCRMAQAHKEVYAIARALRMRGGNTDQDCPSTTLLNGGLRAFLAASGEYSDLEPKKKLE